MLLPSQEHETKAKCVRQVTRDSRLSPSTVGQTRRNILRNKVKRLFEVKICSQIRYEMWQSRSSTVISQI